MQAVLKSARLQVADFAPRWTLAECPRCTELCLRLFIALDAKKRATAALRGIAEPDDAAVLHKARAAAEQTRLDADLIQLELDRHKRSH